MVNQARSNKSTEVETAFNSSSQTKSRKFFHRRVSVFSWLVYHVKVNHVLCKVCRGNKKRNGMTKEEHYQNFQKTALVRQTALTKHQMALLKPHLPEQCEANRAKPKSEQNKAILVLLTTGMFTGCVWKIKTSVCKHPLRTLQALQWHFRLPSPTLEEELKERLPNPSILTGLADQSTDIVNVKWFHIYTINLSDDMKSNTYYITTIGCKDSTGAGIVSEILSEFQWRIVTPEKIMCLGLNGAFVMTGKTKGL